MKNRIIIYIVLIVFFAPFNLLASADSLTIRYDSSSIKVLDINSINIDTYKSDKAFDYKEYKFKNSIWQKFKKWIYNILLKIFEWLFGQKKSISYLSTFIKIFSYLGLGALIYLIVRFLFNANFIKYFREHGEEAEVKYGEDEEIIRKKDIDQLLKNAIDNSDYRLGLRFYFLKLLKTLEAKKVIKWEPQKTNFDYLKEIKQDVYNDTFKRFTYWYDYIWYGNYPLTSLEFTAISKEFEAFFKKLLK